MAIFHLHVRTHSRSDGRSAVAAAAYRAGVALVDARTGERHDYRRKRGVVGASLVMPPLAPAWTRAELWDAVERAETRKNSCVARECEVALPHEVPLEDQARLADGFARWLSDRYSIAVDVALHQPTRNNDQRNVHAHMLLSTRALGPDGFGAKTRVLDAAATGGPEIEVWRSEWANRVNALLAERRIDVSIDQRSHAERGLAQIPTIKEGRSAGAEQRKVRNGEVRALNDQMQQLLAERAAAEAAEKIKAAEIEARETVRRIAQDEESRRAAELEARERVEQERRAEAARQARAIAERRARELVAAHGEREAIRAAMSAGGREIYELKQQISRAPRADTVRGAAAALDATNERSAQPKTHAAAVRRRLAQLPGWRFLARRRAREDAARLQHEYEALKVRRSELQAAARRTPVETLRARLLELEREHQARAELMRTPLPQLTEAELALIRDNELRRRAGALVAIERPPRSDGSQPPRLN